MKRCAPFAAAMALGMTGGCAPAPPSMPSNVVSSAAALHRSAPVRLAPDAPPAIVAMHFSALDVKRGGDWSGEVVTSTNVASVEVRTNLFSLDLPRVSFGRFAFRLNVLDVPPIFVRAYRLRVIARNAAGAQGEEDLPFRIR